MRILSLLLLCAAPALAGDDAAMRAREGDINHWIEYYQRERQAQRPSKPVAPETPEVPEAQSGRTDSGATGKETRR